LHEAIAHAPLVHVAVAFARTHAFPQDPQLATLVFVFVLQSSPMSQLANPGSQLATTHMPPTQPAIPFATVQTSPHPPQFIGLFVVLTSHPSDSTPLQSWKPGRHAPIEHMPFVQVGVALGVTQTLPHLPQLAALVDVLTSQPSLRLPSQFAKPAAHSIPHAPPVQVGVELGPEAHMLPHDPQFKTVVVLVPHPFDVPLVSQLAKPGSQERIPHIPLTQLGTPFATVHALVQLPHAAGSLDVCVSHPLAGFMSQSLHPCEHEIPHLPSLQTGFDSGP
jgi:hypothetical protein